MALWCGADNTSINKGGYLKLSSALITAVPLTIAAWVAHPEAPGSGLSGFIAAIGNSITSTNWFALKREPTNAWTAATNASSATSSATYSKQASWQHAAATFASATSRSIFVGGEESASNSSNVTPAGLDTTTIGVVQSGASVNSTRARCLIAHVAFYNVVLTKQEIAALAAGALPIQVRPTNLISWVPGDYAHGFSDVMGRIWTPTNGIQISSAMPKLGAYSNPTKQLLRRLTGIIVPSVGPSSSLAMMGVG